MTARSRSGRESADDSALLGLLVSGALLEAFAWQSVFAFTGCLGVVALIAAAWIAPNSKLDRARLDVAGGVLSALGLSALVYAIIEGPARGWTDPVTLAAFAAALLMLVAFVAWELRRREPLLDPRLFRLPGFGAGTVSIAVQFFGFFGFIFVVLQYVRSARGASCRDGAIGVRRWPRPGDAHRRRGGGACRALRLLAGAPRRGGPRKLAL